MDRKQMENIYKTNGLYDFKLRDLDDLYKIHGINYKEIKGYNELQNNNKLIFRNFILNFFNIQGLEKRNALIPIGIYYVEEIEYLTKEDSEDDYFIPYGGVIRSINKNGSKTILHTWNDKEYKDFKLYKTEILGTYLRFEYKANNINEWQHVINAKEWY